MKRSKRDRYIEQRVLDEANYIVENNATIRQAANMFGVSKSAVHRDMVKVLPELNATLHIETLQVLNHNLAVRHIRGGLATQKRYRA